MPKAKPGTVGWIDLTVKRADRVAEFYRKVVGWLVEPLDMGGYCDYVMRAPGTRKALAGVCHARGPNKDLPPQWLLYVVVPNIKASVATCRKLGGTVRRAPRTLAGYGTMAVVRDPGGAYVALFQPEEKKRGRR